MRERRERVSGDGSVPSPLVHFSQSTCSNNAFEDPSVVCPVLYYTIFKYIVKQSQNPRRHCLRGFCLPPLLFRSSVTQLLEPVFPDVRCKIRMQHHCPPALS